MRFVLAPCPCLFDSTQEPCVRQKLLRSSFFFEIPQLRNVCKLAALVSRRRVHTAGMSPRNKGDAAAKTFHKLLDGIPLRLLA